MAGTDSLPLLIVGGAILVGVVAMSVTLANPIHDTITDQDEWRASDTNESINKGQKRTSDYVNNLVLIFAGAIAFNAILLSRRVT